MKKLTWLSLLVIVALSAFCSTMDPSPLLGRWENIQMNQGAPMSLVSDFKADGSFEILINKQPFVTGKYRLKHDTLYVNDTNCGDNTPGTYKVQFWKTDSLKFHVISDACLDRKEGTDGFLFKKINTLAKQ